MWDNHQALALLSNWLFVLIALIVLYVISQWTINLPVFPLKEVSVSGSGSGELKHVTRDQIDGGSPQRSQGKFFYS